MSFKCVLLLALVAGISALPADPVVLKWDNSNAERYSYLEDDNGQAHLVDNWLKVSDLEKMARYNPDKTNKYHLYTRANSFRSQPLVLNDEARVKESNYNPKVPTIVLMHGFAGGATSDFNTVLMPAYLAAADCNVIVLDWSSGSNWGPRARQAGEATGRFINWLNSVTGSKPEQYHVVGFSVGGHGAGIIARNVDGKVGYVISLDPAERWDDKYIFKADDGIYTEVLHTSSIGEPDPLGQVDIYTNGGSGNPGCMTSLCNHNRSFHYLAESLKTGGFTAIKCATLAEAKASRCTGPDTLALGGFKPKNGKTGIYHVTTNPYRPFSKE